MTVETASFISELDATKPTALDPKSEGDNHIRLVKATIKAQFPNFGAGAVTATHTELNNITNAIFADSSGNVGIGTDSPDSSAGYTITTCNGPSGSYTSYKAGGALAGRIGAEATYLSIEAAGTRPMLFNSGGLTRMRLLQTGEFVVGADSAGLTNTNSSTLEGKYTVHNHATAEPSGTRYTYYGHAGVQIGSISQDGTTGVLYNTTSDYRLKTGQAALTGSGAFIDALKPKTWTWANGTRGAGFIAHEFAAVSPSSVAGTKDAVDADGRPEYQAMQASSPEVMANIAAELQSLRLRVAALELP